MTDVLAFLGTPTPPAWLDAACADVETLLIDHANCEKKAASSALALLYRHVDKPDLLQRLARLAREELRHFEQVHALLTRRGIGYRQLDAGRYAAALHREISPGEPARLVDTLLVGAIVEARSCERFSALAPRLDSELSMFYRRLAQSEARHFSAYLALAQTYAPAAIEPRLERLLAVESALIVRPDPRFRFHSGPPGRARPA